MSWVRWDSVQIEDLIFSWIDFKSLVALNIVSTSMTKLLQSWRVWRNVIATTGRLSALQTAEIQSSEFWKILHKKMFHRQLRSYTWQESKIPIDALKQFILYNSPYTYCISDYGPVRNYALQLQLLSPTKLIVCGQKFIVSIERADHDQSKWVFLLRLEEYRRCIEHCNCSFRGKLWCFLFVGQIGHTVEGEVAGCYTCKILDSDIMQLLEAQNGQSFNMMLYLQVVKGFMADPVNSLVYN